MSTLAIKNIVTESHSTPLVLTTGEQSPFIKILSTNSTIIFGETSNVVITNYSSVESIWIGAGAMTPNLSNGATPLQIETSANKTQYSVLVYSPTEDQSASFFLRMPKSWNKGNLDCSLILSHVGVSVESAKVTYNVFASVINSGNAFSMESVNTSNCCISITTGNNNKIYVSDSSHYLTGNLKAKGIGTSENSPVLFFSVSRVPNHAQDDLVEESHLHGIQLKYGTNKENEY